MQTAIEHPWRLAVGGLLALAVAMGIGRFVYTPILPLMAESLPLTKAEAGFLASANFLGYLIGALLAATPWIGGSRRTWLVGALLASALTTLATGLSTAVWALATIRFLAGAASAFVFVFASSLVLDRLASATRSDLAGVHFAGVGVGIAVSAALVTLLHGGDYGWREQWIAAGLLSLAMVPLTAALVPPDRGGAAGPVRSGPMSVGPRLWALIAAYGLFGFGYVITATFLVAIVRASPALSPLDPVVWIVVGLAASPSVGLWSAFGRRIGVFAAFAVACLTEAAGVLASVLSASAAGTILAAVFLGGTFVGITALGLVGARTLTASDARRVLALMTGAFGLGQTVGPVTAGALFDRTGSFTLPSLLAAGALVIASGLAWGLDPKRVSG